MPRRASSIFGAWLLAAWVLTALEAVEVDSPVLVVCGPSGVGKTTVIDGLVKDLPGQFAFPLTTTTRAARPTEKNGVDYDFVSSETFAAREKEGKFVVVSPHNGFGYGMTANSLERAVVTGKLPLVEHISSAKALELKVSGVLTHAKYVMIVPPGKDLAEMQAVLKQRLMERGTDDRAAVNKRLHDATDELKYASKEGLWDRVIVNDDVDEAVQDFRDFVLKAFPARERSELQRAATVPNSLGVAVSSRLIFDHALWGMAAATAFVLLPLAIRWRWRRMASLSECLLADPNPTA